MRAVLLGTDLLKDVDGSFKAIETNTNIQTSVDVSLYFNQNEFHNFITQNAINEIVYISKQELDIKINDIEVNDDNEVVTNNASKGLNETLAKYCTDNGFTYTPMLLDSNAVTIPFVEDNPNKLILRVTYDTTALIDDTYARDNWEFLKLMNDADPNSIAKTYINDVELGFDSIGSTIRDNNGHPNYVVKKRVTPADNKIFPKLLKINSVEELELIKGSLEVDEYIQEYIFNPNDLLDGRTKYYRSVDLVYGSNLDILNLWCIEHTNALRIDELCDFDNNGLIQFWERPKYIYKFINVGDKQPQLSGDENTIVLLQDGSKVNLSTLPAGSLVKTIAVPNLPLTENYSTSEWSTSFNDFMENYAVDTAELKSKNVTPNWIGFFKEIETADGIKFSDVSHATVLCKELESGSTENYVIKFKQYEDINIGDFVLLFDTENSIMVEKEITNISISYGKVDVYNTDFEQIDLFLTMEESENSKWAILTHNYNYDCRQYSCYPYCYDCYNNWLGGQGVFGCCRCEPYGGYSYYFYCYQTPFYCYDCVDANFQTDCTTGSYCNQDKSDKRLKKKVKHIKTLENGIKIYQFEFKKHFIDKVKLLYDDDVSGVWEGVLAQDLIDTPNEIYVTMDSDGYYQVDYKGLGIRLIKVK